MNLDREHAHGCPCHWCGGEDGAQPVYAKDQGVPTYSITEVNEDGCDISQLCNMVKASIREITSRVRSEENERMKRLPASKNSGGKQLSRLPDAQGGKGDFNPFLKADNIAARGMTTLTFLGNVRESSSQFSDIIAEVQNGKKKYDFGIKFSSGNYPRLLARFGNNPAKWRGKVKVVRAEYLGKQYVQVVD